MGCCDNAEDGEGHSQEAPKLREHNKSQADIHRQDVF
jgi:hypothetical protein